MKEIYTWSVKTLLVIFISTLIFVSGETFAEPLDFGQQFATNTFFSYGDRDVELKILKLVNDERIKRNLRGLVLDSRLSKVARSHSIAMAKEDFFSHYGSDGSTVVDRAKDFNITKWRKIGENLFTCRGYDSPETVAVKGWIKSSSHRKNMLERAWTMTGIGVARSKDGDIYITQVFLTY